MQETVPVVDAPEAVKQYLIPESRDISHIVARYEEFVGSYWVTIGDMVNTHLSFDNDEWGEFVKFVNEIDGFVKKKNAEVVSA